MPQTQLEVGAQWPSAFSFQPGIHVPSISYGRSWGWNGRNELRHRPYRDKQASEGDTKSSHSPWPKIGIHHLMSEIMDLRMNQ